MGKFTMFDIPNCGFGSFRIKVCPCLLNSIPFETFATVRALLPELEVMAPAANQRIA